MKKRAGKIPVRDALKRVVEADKFSIAPSTVPVMVFIVSWAKVTVAER